MRAYSHQGHGPRADQIGRIHISDFRNSRTISIAKRSRSIHSGQKLKSLLVLVMSASPAIAEVPGDNDSYRSEKIIGPSSVGFAVNPKQPLLSVGNIDEFQRTLAFGGRPNSATGQQRAR